MSGPWTAEKEAAYKRQMLLVNQFFPKQDVSGMSDSQVKKNDKALLAEFEKLRLGRLLAYLRQREPDKMIGYSILIYELTTKDIYEAIWGPSKSFVGLGA